MNKNLRVYEQLRPNQRQDLVIYGNFNIDLLADSSSLFQNNMNSIGLFPVISKTTRVTGISAPIIDNIFRFIKLPCDLTPRILTFELSDHFPVFIVSHNFLNCNQTNTQPI